VNPVQMRIAGQQIARGRPSHERLNGRAGKIQPQFMNQRRGEQRVAIASQRDHQNVHNREIFSSSPVVDLPGTNGTSTMRPPADSTARRSF